MEAAAPLLTRCHKFQFTHKRTKHDSVEFLELSKSIVESKNLSGADEGVIPDIKLYRRPDASEYLDSTHIG